MDVSATVTAGNPPVIITQVTTPPTVGTTQPSATTTNTTPPTNAVTIDLDAKSDSGTSDTDNITNDKKPTITGVTDIPFSKVEILENGKVIATTTSNAKGEYSVDTPALTDASHTFTVQATAPSATIAVTSPNLDVTVDTSVNAADDKASATEDTTASISGSVINNDDHTNGETVAATTALKTAHGVYTLNADGTYTFVVDNTASQSLAAGDTVVDMLTYEITDKAGNKTTATLETTITGTNDAPTVSAKASLHAIDEDTTIVLNKAELLSQASDIDKSDVLHIENITAKHGTVSVDAQTREIHYTPNADFNGKETFTYDIVDSHNAIVQTTATMTVNPVDDTVNQN